MTIAELPRRLELKLRYRSAILDSARALIDERGGPTFTVDELAERAGVARRTVFNYFAGLDDVVMTVCADTLAVLIDDFLAVVAGVPLGDGTASAMFDELATAMRTSDLPKAIATVSKAIGGVHAPAARRVEMSDAALARVGGRLLEEVGKRNPGVDPLDAALLVNTLTHGTGVLAETWLLRTDGRLEPDSLAEWSTLMARLLERTRTGYAPS